MASTIVNASTNSTADASSVDAARPTVSHPIHYLPLKRRLLVAGVIKQLSPHVQQDLQMRELAERGLGLIPAGVGDADGRGVLRPPECVPVEAGGGFPPLRGIRGGGGPRFLRGAGGVPRPPP